VLSFDTTPLVELAERAHQELSGNLLPFWLRLEDTARGGHFGWVSFDGAIDSTKPKGAVVTARLLWFFSEVHRVLQNPEAGVQAGRTKRFLLDHLVDRDHDGLLWSVSADGQIHEGDKHLYAQAFGIYGLSACARAFADEEAAAAALRLFRKIRDQASTTNGFVEAFDQHWQEMPNRRMSAGRTTPAPRSFNTHLHLLEALTLLANLDIDPAPRVALDELLRLILDRFLVPDRSHSCIFLDDSLAALPGPRSFGHDIEASWLIDAAADAVGDQGLSAEARAAASKLARSTASAAQMYDGSFVLEPGHPWRIWWVQAEALVSLVNEAERSGSPEYLARAQRLWDYIESRIKDPIHGEWHSRVDAGGVPDSSQPKVDPWKEPYHQGRACLELIERSRRHAQQRP
jgi:cellobiose epimerase